MLSALSAQWPLILTAIYCIFIIAASLLGGWLPSKIRLTHTRMQLVLSVVGGFMVGIAVFHLLPHAALELKSLDAAAGWLMAGLLGMFLLIRMFHFHQHGPLEDDESCSHSVHVHDHHGHGHEHHHGHAHQAQGVRLSWTAVTFGLAVHTLIDGVALAASVKTDAGHMETGLLGFGTFLAVLLHKPLDAVSVTSLMAVGGWSSRARSIVNAGFALMCPAGALLFFFGVGQAGGKEQWIVGAALAFAAGTFLCIALGDLLPELEFHAHDRAKLTAALLAGVALSYSIRYLEPEHAHGVELEHSHDHHDHGHSHDHNHAHD